MVDADRKSGFPGGKQLVRASQCVPLGALDVHLDEVDAIELQLGEHVIECNRADGDRAAALRARDVSRLAGAADFELKRPW